MSIFSKTKIVAKYFRLPIDEGLYNKILNDPDMQIVDKKVNFDSKSGDIVVYLEYEMPTTQN